MTSKFKGNKLKGFRTLEEAKAYMVQEKVAKYAIKLRDIPYSEEVCSSKISGYYTVANGREPGIYKRYL